jgi:hypothetical protein
MFTAGATNASAATQLPAEQLRPATIGRLNVKPNGLFRTPALPTRFPDAFECHRIPELCQNGTLKATRRVGRDYGGTTVGRRTGKGGPARTPRNALSVPFWHTTPSSLSLSICNRCPKSPCPSRPLSGRLEPPKLAAGRHCGGMIPGWYQDGTIEGRCGWFLEVILCKLFRRSPLPKSPPFYHTQSYLTNPSSFPGQTKRRPTGPGSTPLKPHPCHPCNVWLKLPLLEAAQTTPAIRILLAGHSPWQSRHGPLIVHSCSVGSKLCQLRFPTYFPIISRHGCRSVLSLKH